MPRKRNEIDRRDFLRTTAAGVGAAALGNKLAHAAEEQPATQPAESQEVIWRNRNPEMEYRRLGRTQFMVSRIVHGWGGDESLWRRILGTGVNYFDTALGYGNLEVELKPFLARYRDRLWVTSKVSDLAGYTKIDEGVQELYRKAMKAFLGKDEGHLLSLHDEAVAKQKATGEKPDLRAAGQRMARLYAEMLDRSLQRMGIECVDCYMMHGLEIPWMFDCLDIWETYTKAHKAGKVKHFGFSVHQHHKEVLAATVEANARGPWKIDLIMPGVNPESFDRLKPELAALKKQDVGIVAMKTSGIKNRPVDGREQKLTDLMGGREYNEWERAKLWMLHLTEDLIDACIAAMSNVEEMAKDIRLPSVKLTAAAERELRALVKLEMAGACHLCGSCTTACPEHIAVTDMIRYHAYVHQYNDKALARELYAKAGYDPSRLCNHCGVCADVCPSDVRISEILAELPLAMRA